MPEGAGGTEPILEATAHHRAHSYTMVTPADLSRTQGGCASSHRPSYGRDSNPRTVQGNGANRCPAQHNSAD